MKTSLIVIDNFYDNIDEVREFALYLPFDVFGNYPGARTKNHFTESAKNIIENALNLNSEKRELFSLKERERDQKERMLRSKSEHENI